MAAAPVIRRIEFVSPVADLKSESGGADIRVHLEDGSSSTFGVLTPDHVRRRLNDSGKDFSFGHPILFVRRLDEEALGKAIAAMAADMSGFWLRYYNTAPAAKKSGRALARKKK